MTFPLKNFCNAIRSSTYTFFHGPRQGPSPAAIHRHVLPLGKYTDEASRETEGTRRTRLGKIVCSSISVSDNTYCNCYFKTNHLFPAESLSHRAIRESPVATVRAESSRKDRTSRCACRRPTPMPRHLLSADSTITVPLRSPPAATVREAKPK